MKTVVELFVVMIAFTVGANSWAEPMAGPAELPKELDPNASYWYALNYPEEYTGVCHRDEEGREVCEDTCPRDLNAICAEYRDAFSSVGLACCIPAVKVGSTDIGDCIQEVVLRRSDDEPRESVFE